MDEEKRKGERMRLVVVINISVWWLQSRRPWSVQRGTSVTWRRDELWCQRASGATPARLEW